VTKIGEKKRPNFNRNRIATSKKELKNIPFQSIVPVRVERGVMMGRTESVICIPVLFFPLGCLPGYSHNSTSAWFTCRCDEGRCSESRTQSQVSAGLCDGLECVRLGRTHKKFGIAWESGFVFAGYYVPCGAGAWLIGLNVDSMIPELRAAGEGKDTRR
jgi:hypothetical protein